MRSSGRRSDIQFKALACSSCSVSCYAAGREVSIGLLRSKPFVWIGLLSYTLYLCHMAIFKAIGTGFVKPVLGRNLGLPIALFMRS